MTNNKLKTNYDLVKYSIPSFKLQKGNFKKVILIADLHDYTKNNKKADMLAEAIKEKNPNHVVIAGDNIQGKKWESKRAIDDFSRFIDNVSEEAPVFISQGNHDLVGINEKNKDVRISNFKALEGIRPGKVYSLVNDKVLFDNFEIIGYTPNHETIGGLGIQKYGKAHLDFIKEYQENGLKPSKDSDNIVEFVGHNPHLIAQSDGHIGLADLKNVDTFYAGHLHNGYLRSTTTKKNPDKYLDNGIVEQPYIQDRYGNVLEVNPLFFGKTNLCRGVIYINDKSNKKILQLNNGNFYINNEDKFSSPIWIPTYKETAIEEIEKNNLHALVITGGVRKYFGFNIPGDEPEITEVTYKGIK